jgi:hypothetical protein
MERLRGGLSGHEVIVKREDGLCCAFGMLHGAGGSGLCFHDVKIVAHGASRDSGGTIAVLSDMLLNGSKLLTHFATVEITAVPTPSYASTTAHGNYAG